MATANTARLKNSLGGHKSTVTRLIGKGTRLVEALSANPLCEYTAQEAELTMQRLAEKEKDIEGTYQQLLLLAADAPAATALNTDCNDIMGTIDTARSHIRKALADAAQTPASTTSSAPATTNSGSNNPIVKPVTALKPFQLTREHTPAELRTWLEAWKAYHTASHFDIGTPQEQRAYFYACLAPEITARLQLQATASTSIYGTTGNSLVEFLRDEWLLRYPLFSRRLEFFQLKQTHGQAFTDFMAKLKALGNEANLSQLTIDELYAFLAFAGTHDNKLRERLVKIERPSYDGYWREGTAYEVGVNLMRAAAGKSNTAASLGTREKKEQRKQDQHEKKQKIPSNKDDKQCNNCGRSATHEICAAKDKVCNKCDRRGHFARFCKSKGEGKSANSIQHHAGFSLQHSIGTCVSSSDSFRITTAEKEAIETPSSTPLVQATVSQGDSTSIVDDCLPDTGATISVLLEKQATRSKLSIDGDVRPEITTASGSALKCIGATALEITVGGQCASIVALVVKHLGAANMIVSWQALQLLRIIPMCFPKPMKSRRGRRRGSRSVNAVQTASDERQDPRNPNRSESRIRSSSQTSASGLNKPEIIEGKTDWEAVREYFVQKYPQTLSDTLGEKALKGEPVHLNLDKSAPRKPRQTLTARLVPAHWQEEARKEVKKLLENGVLEKVDKPTKGISPGFFVEKEGGKAGLRLVTDYTSLNKFVQRPVHPFPSTHEILQQINPKSGIFCKMDCVQGYFQVPLDEESKDLTTFLLPTGCYRYTRAPMGLNASSDEFCRRSDEALQDLPGLLKLVDDTLLQADSDEKLFNRIDCTLARCEREGLTMSLQKFQVGKKVKFAGHIISPEGIQPDPDRVKAIKAFPAPSNVSELRSFLGLANQLGMFVPDLAHMTASMRELLKKNVAFQWLDRHQADFDDIKKLLTSDVIVHAYNPNLPTELLTDASRLHGLGFALMQREANGNRKLVVCGSRSLTPAECRYATIELELLGIAWVCRKANFYLKGSKFVVVTDHRPLLGIFAKTLDALTNPSLVRLREHLQPYDFDVEWVAGITHLIADALSRAPVFAAEETKDEQLLCSIAIETEKNRSSDPLVGLNHYRLCPT